MVYSKSVDELEPQPALMVETARGLEALSPVKKHVLGVFNEKGQLIVKRGNELVSVEFPKV